MVKNAHGGPSDGNGGVSSYGEKRRRRAVVTVHLVRDGDWFCSGICGLANG